MQIVIDWGRRGLIERAYIVHGEPIADLSGAEAWSVELAHGRLSSAGSACGLRNTTGDPKQRACFEGRTPAFRWEVEYRTTGPGRITKVFRVLPQREALLRGAALWAGNSAAPPLIGHTKIQEFAAFYRHRSRGLFVSLDFPYSRIGTSGSATCIGYRPFDPLPAGEWYECHSVTLGATRLKDSAPAGFDTGEIEAFDNYVQNHRPPRFDRPMNVYASIVNRYTQVHRDTVFYTMKDQPTLAFNTGLVERDLALMTKLGMEYYQVFPGAFEWPANDPRAKVDRLVRIARDRGLRIGDYSAATRVYSPHFNIGNNRLNHPEWLVENERGETIRDTYCFGHAGFERYYSETVTSNCRRYGFELHCLDMLRLVPCYASSHGHPAGPDSLYHQVRGLLRMIASVNAVAPQMMTWPNSGDWLELLPKLAWYSPNLYLTDPFIDTPWQGLNMTRLLDDSRRGQMVSLHHDSLLPYRFFTNCQYFFSQNSVVPDIRNFEYGALSTLAVTPNLCLGEFRPWVDRLSPLNQQRVFTFYQRWTRFVADHYALWKRTFEGGERPGFGSVEVYSHAAGDRGFVFLVNPNYWEREYQIALDSTLGFTANGRCEIAELYPVEHLWLTAQGPWPRFGTKLPVRIPPQTVIVLEVRPAPEALDRACLYGVPGAAESTSGGYRVKTRGPQGRTTQFAVMLPSESPPVASVAALDYGNEPDPRLWAPTPVKLLGSGRDGALIEVTFRRDAAPRHLPDWKARPASLEDGIASGWNTGLPPAEPVRFPLFVDAGIRMPLSPADADRHGLGPAANFCGAYIENAFSEDQETWIDLVARGPGSPAPISWASTAGSTPLRTIESVASAKDNAWWFEAAFHLPFLYQIGAEPSADNHTLIVFPLFRSQHLRDLRLWINGRDTAVQYYAYPRNRKLGCHYADLVGSAAHGGDNQIVAFCNFDASAI